MATYPWITNQEKFKPMYNVGITMEEKVKEWQKKIESEKTRYAEAGKNFEQDAPSAYGALLQNIAYYSKGEGYQSALKDWEIQQTEPIAKSLGLTASQLMTNPQLYTDKKALAQYTGGTHEGVSYAPGTPAWQALQTPIKPPIQPPATSYIQSGQDYIKQRQERGLKADAATIKKLYRDWGLEQRLGTWTGSAEQYRAMGQYENQQWESIQAGIAEATKQTQELQQRVATEGITDKEGKVLKEPTEPPISGEGGLTGGQNITDTPEIQIDTEDFSNVINNAIDSIGSTDLADIMTEVSAEGWSPEMTIAGEQKQADLDTLKTNAATALQTMQQNLAKRGLTFSGIRSQKEASLAAETIAQEAGINRDFALKIVQAARNEQQRRETAIKAAETKYMDALESLGYAYNPFTDKIEPSLEYKKLAADLGMEKAQLLLEERRTKAAETELAKPFEEGGYIYQWNDATGKYEQIGTKSTTEGLTTTQLQSALDRVSDDYRQDPIVKQFTQVASGWSYMSSVDTNTSNPADDIGMIYALSKIFDPESVVREGEYATVQKYAQSWAEKFGFEAQRIFSNEKFLSSQAISNMKAAAKKKYESSQKMYGSTRQEYQQRVNDLMGGKTTTTLPDYSKTIPSEGWTGQTSSGVNYSIEP